MSDTEKPQNDLHAAGDLTPEATKGRKIHGGLKFALDFVPLVMFFYLVKYQGIMIATAVFMITSCLSMAVHWVVERHVPLMLKVTTGLILVMGGLTIFLDNPVFVKMKMSIILSLMAGALLWGLWRDKIFLEKLMGEALKMEPIGWRILSRNYAFFLLLMAAVNEVIWRTQSDETWAAFKAFGVFPLMLAFMVGQMIFLFKYTDWSEEEKDS